jgi:hypothetical protein
MYLQGHFVSLQVSYKRSAFTKGKYCNIGNLLVKVRKIGCSMFMLVDGFFLIKHIMVLQFGGKFGNLGSHLQEIIATGQQLGENL